MPPKSKKRCNKGKKDKPEKSKKKSPQSEDGDEGLNDADLRVVAQDGTDTTPRDATPVQDIPPQAQEKDQPSPASPPSSHHASEDEEDVAQASPGKKSYRSILSSASYVNLMDVCGL